MQRDGTSHQNSPEQLHADVAEEIKYTKRGRHINLPRNIGNGITDL